MRQFRDIFLLSLLILGTVNGQVCCSLVGAANNSNGGSLSNWNAHWPSPRVQDKQWHWVSGFNIAGSDNADHRIQYGIGTSGFVQLSRSIKTGTIGFIHSDLSTIKISESLSFDGSSTGVNSLNVGFGIRQLISQQVGVVSGEIIFPMNPYYTQRDFSFKTGVVPSYHISWNRNYYTHPGQLINKLIPNMSFSLGYTKNLKQKDNVFTDDKVDLHLSGTINSFVKLDVSPFVSASLEKLIAPLSPWDKNRQTRWLGVASIGIDFAPTAFSWNWLKLRAVLPVYGWYSEIGFPDGTQPSASVLITVVKNGVFNKWKKD